MTNEQKVIERNEFGCADGKQAMLETYNVLGRRVREVGVTPEGDTMLYNVDRAYRALYAAEQALSDAYDAVGEWERASR